MNAYGRLYKEYMLAIYNKICNNVSELPKENDYLFCWSIKGFTARWGMACCC